jgi:SAM-dependent methyltransferase
MNLNKLLLRLKHRASPDRVSFGSLRNLSPVSRSFGLDRGHAIDRYYIEAFLEAHRDDIRGVVLEVGDREYTDKFGKGQVARSEVLHAAPGNPAATMIGDLATGQGISDAAFDCIILTQTLTFIYDIKGAVANCHRALKPGGVVLATLPGISQISRYDMNRWGDYWRVTSLAARRMFEETFGAGNVQVQAHGNVLTAIAFIEGLSQEELTKKELDFSDPDYELVLTVRAVRSRDGKTP